MLQSQNLASSWGKSVVIHIKEALTWCLLEQLNWVHSEWNLSDHNVCRHLERLSTTEVSSFHPRRFALPPWKFLVIYTIVKPSNSDLVQKRVPSWTSESKTTSTSFEGTERNQNTVMRFELIIIEWPHTLFTTQLIFIFLSENGGRLHFSRYRINFKRSRRLYCVSWPKFKFRFI